MNSLRVSYDLLNVAPLLYFTAMTLGVFYWVRRGRLLYVSIPVVAGLALLCHTTALGIRWVEGGLYRPPWTNLYESLVYFSWGLAVVAYICELKFRVRYLGIFAYALVFAALGMAYLTPGKAINPLVPSLQSWWILAHSCLAAFAYSGLVVGSIFAFLYLVKVGLDQRLLGLWTAILGVVGILLAGGTDLLIRSEYRLYELVSMGERWVRNPIPGTDPVEYFQVEVPGVAVLLWISLGLYTVSLLAYGFFRRLPPAGLKGLIGAAVGLHIGTIAWIYSQAMTRPSLSLASNPYHLAFITAFGAVQIFLLIDIYYPRALAKHLPTAEKLDRMSLSLIHFGFPFMTLILITGAIWAHEAWGRYWGWDPKETTALMTWLIYALYIHARRVRGWAGRRAAVVAVVGFYSVIFTYLGSNLVLSGLHSYGAQ